MEFGGLSAQHFYSKARIFTTGSLPAGLCTRSWARACGSAQISTRFSWKACKASSPLESNNLKVVTEPYKTSNVNDLILNVLWSYKFEDQVVETFM